MAKIPQKEVLTTVRARSGLAFEDVKKYISDRGPRSKMRLLPLQSTPTGPEVYKNILKRLTDTSNLGGWNEFFLTDVQCQMNEKVQVMELFGDNHVAYYFGKSPVMMTLTGILFDDIDNEWFTKFITMYENYLRGSHTARNSTLLEITLPNLRVICSIVSFSYNQNSARDTDIPFSLQILVKTYEPLPLNIPEVEPADLTNKLRFDQKNSFLDQSGINSLKAVSNITELIQNPYKPSTTADMAMNLTDLGFSTNGGLSTGFGLTQSQINLGNSTRNVGGPAAAQVSLSCGPDDLTKSVAPSMSSLGLDTSQLPLSGNTVINAFSEPTLLKGDKPSGGSNTLPYKLPSTLVIGGIASTLTGFSANLFSPVYGFLSSITKVVKSVTGDLSKILLSFNSNTNDILRNVNSVLTEANKIVSLVTTGIDQLLNIPKSVTHEIIRTINNLRKTAGAIARVPFTVSSSVQSLVTAGRMNKASNVLRSGKGRKKNLSVILYSAAKSSYSGTMVLPSSIKAIA